MKKNEKSNKDIVKEIINLLHLLESNTSKNKDLNTILIFVKGKLD